ncbi:MAG: hypothetical protein ABSE46_16760 [Terracidiphilus sp.]
MRYADGSDTLRRDKSGIEWKHEGFGFDKLALPHGVAVPREPALCPDGFAAGCRTNHRGLDSEDGRDVESEKDSGEGEIDYWSGKDGYGVGEAQKAREPVWKDDRDAGKQGGKSGADRTH